MTEIENNPHQALIKEQVADFFAKSKVHMKSNPHGRCAVEHTLIQTLQATIDTVAAEQRSSIKIDSSDMQKVGDHYWGGDYEPTYYELEKLTESMNEILQTKLKALDKTPLPDKNSL